jgi:hypothetical protein
MPRIDVTADVYSTLQVLADDRGAGVGEVLAEAVGLKIAVTAAQDDGWQLLLEKDGKLRRLD